MTLSTVHLEHITPQAWKNGGGATRELLAWPQGADWLLRVSVAAIDRDGPFSALPGFERWFAVVSGPGVTLALPSGQRVVKPGMPPLQFDGADAPQCQMLGAPTTDLNLLIRTSAGQGAMRAAAPGEEWVSQARWQALYAADTMDLQIDGIAVGSVSAGSLVYSTEGHRQRWYVQPQDPRAARAWWMECKPRGGAIP